MECDFDILIGRCASCPFKSLFEKFDAVSDNDRSLFPSHELVPSEGLASTIFSTSTQPGLFQRQRSLQRYREPGNACVCTERP